MLLNMHFQSTVPILKTILMYSEKVVGPRLSTKKEVKCLPAIGFSCLLFYALCFYGRVVLGTGEGSIVITESSSGVVRSSCD